MSDITATINFFAFSDKGLARLHEEITQEVERGKRGAGFTAEITNEGPWANQGHRVTVIFTFENGRGPGRLGDLVEPAIRIVRAITDPRNPNGEVRVTWMPVETAERYTW